MKRKKRRRRRSILSIILILFGILCLAGAAGLGLYNLWDSWRAGQASEEILDELADRIADNMRNKKPYIEQVAEDGETEAESEDGLLHTIQMMNPGKEMPVEEIDGYRYIGFLEIPSINLSLPVMEEWEYERLKISPCRFSGSYYADDLVICAHNYIRHFTPVKDDLGMGEDVYFTNVLGESLHYRTVNKETLPGSALEEMVNNSNNSDSPNEWDLTLFTCSLGGGSRSAVRCQRVK